MTTPPPTTPAGAPPPPAQTAALEAATLQSVVDALKPMFDAQAPNIDTWQTRLLVERKLDEKKANGPLQGADMTAYALFEMSTNGWDNPAVKSGTLLRAACAIMGINPVPAATQPPAQDSTTNFPASLPEVTEATATISDNKEMRNLRKQVAHLETKTKGTRRLAVVAFVVAVISSVLGLIMKLVAWIATSPSWVVAILTAVVAFGIGVFASGRVADWFKKRH